jgi:hypothetical protein
MMVLNQALMSRYMLKGVTRGVQVALKSGIGGTVQMCLLVLPPSRKAILGTRISVMTFYETYPE